MMNKIQPTLFAACNMDYFYQHGYVFAKSAVDNDNFVRISVWHDIVNEESQRKFFNFMTQFYETIDHKKCQIDLISHNTLNVIRDTCDVLEDRALYASMRFILLEEVLLQEAIHGRSVLVLDIDSIIMKKIEVPEEYDIGVFSRENEVINGTEYEIQGMKVAAGALYLKETAQEFAFDIKDNIIHNDIIWFCDQHAIYNAYLDHKNSFNIWNIDKTFLDWEFLDNTYVWTGKGNRKFTDKIYVQKKAEILNGFTTSNKSSEHSMDLHPTNN